MAMDLKEIENFIKEALPDAVIEIQDLACLLYTSPSPRDRG